MVHREPEDLTVDGAATGESLFKSDSKDFAFTLDDLVDSYDDAGTVIYLQAKTERYIKIISIIIYILRVFQS